MNLRPLSCSASYASTSATSPWHAHQARHRHREPAEPGARRAEATRGQGAGQDEASLGLVGGPCLAGLAQRHGLLGMPASLLVLMTSLLDPGQPHQRRSHPQLAIRSGLVDATGSRVRSLGLRIPPLPDPRASQGVEDGGPPRIIGFGHPLDDLQGPPEQPLGRLVPPLPRDQVPQVVHAIGHARMRLAQCAFLGLERPPMLLFGVFIPTHALQRDPQVVAAHGRQGVLRPQRAHVHAVRDDAEPPLPRTSLAGTARSPGWCRYTPPSGARRPTTAR